MAYLLTREWYRAGECVVVVSDTHGEAHDCDEFPFPVYYRPKAGQWLGLLRWSEVFVHMNISLKALWPWLLIRRPLVSVNHTYYYTDRAGNRDWRERLKLRALGWATNIAVSESVASRMPQPCAVIPNPFDALIFEGLSTISRQKDIVYLGRLVSDKGCDLLIQAIWRLARDGFSQTLTIIGDGPERRALEELVVAMDLRHLIKFVGAPSSKEVANLLGQHKIMVVPSLWEESFGIVALEGIASGCVVLGSDGGGLPEAIGPCGTTFRRGDVMDLISHLRMLLERPEDLVKYRAAAAEHLAIHRPDVIARRYVQVLKKAIANKYTQPQ